MFNQHPQDPANVYAWENNNKQWINSHKNLNANRRYVICITSIFFSGWSLVRLVQVVRLFCHMWLWTDIKVEDMYQPSATKWRSAVQWKEHWNWYMSIARMSKYVFARRDFDLILLIYGITMGIQSFHLGNYSRVWFYLQHMCGAFNIISTENLTKHIPKWTFWISSHPF